MSEWSFDFVVFTAPRKPSVKRMVAGMSGISLEPMFNQTPYAPAARILREDVLLADPAYVERLKRHYQMMRDYVDNKGKRKQHKKQRRQYVQS